MGDSPIRVLHVLTAMNMAGTETLLMNIYRNINRENVQFDFAVSENTECAYDKEILKMGGRIFHYPKYRGFNHISYCVWWKKFIKAHPEYHIIHGHIGSTASIYLGIAKKYGRYTIAHSHSTNPTISFHSVIYKLYSYPTRYIANQFFGCSKRALIDRYGEKVANDSSISRVINNAIDARKFIYDPKVRKRIRLEYNIPDDKLVIMTVGRLTNPKNPFEIIRICKQLYDSNLDFLFLWFGDGDLKEEIQKRLNELGIRNVVRLMGNRPDIHNVLQAADIFLFPSLWEGLGIACVEAQAAGLQTLCSNTIPIEAKVTELCHFLPLNNTRVWCDKIKDIISIISSDSYQRPNSFKDILEANYDISALSQELEGYYESIIN